MQEARRRQAADAVALFASIPPPPPGRPPVEGSSLVAPPPPPGPPPPGAFLHSATLALLERWMLRCTAKSTPQPDATVSGLKEHSSHVVQSLEAPAVDSADQTDNSWLLPGEYVVGHIVYKDGTTALEDHSLVAGAQVQTVQEDDSWQDSLVVAVQDVIVPHTDVTLTKVIVQPMLDHSSKSPSFAVSPDDLRLVVGTSDIVKHLRSAAVSDGASPAGSSSEHVSQQAAALQPSGVDLVSAFFEGGGWQAVETPATSGRAGEKTVSMHDLGESTAREGKGAPAAIRAAAEEAVHAFGADDASAAFCPLGAESTYKGVPIMTREGSPKLLGTQQQTAEESKQCQTLFKKRTVARRGKRRR